GNDTPDDRLPQNSRPNFVVRIPGKDKERRIWVMTHLDVVPPGEQNEDGQWKGWDSNPYELRREDDKIYGRGVEDNQQALVASVFAAQALLENKITPQHEVALLFVSGEETGSQYGLQSLLKEYPELFSSDDLIMVPDAGNEDGSIIEIAEKSVLWLTFHIEGKQAHGSMPQLAHNAFRAGAQLACALDEELHKQFDKKDELFSPPYSTFEPTRHGPNVPNINTIPGEEKISFDCRVLPDYDLDEILGVIRGEMERIDSEIGTKTNLQIENRLDAPEPTRKDAPIVRMLQKALRETRQVEGELTGIGGSTVAAFFRQAGYPVVVWSTSEGFAHQVNENCRISNMVADARVFAHIFRQQLP
ncbi:MAG: M20 family metallo-hydrolase, partial [Planctomycetes bacterium]|nr:M20 family metallo-hydrolase [Planctomycetota bacterium]